MVKSSKKKTDPLAGQELKSPKEASNLFHSIMAASVKGNPKPKEKKATAKK